MTNLQPHRWTLLPGTNLVVRWDGEGEITVYRHSGIWDLSPLAARPGYVLAWLGLADHPELGPWPLVPLARRATYLSSREHPPA